MTAEEFYNTERPDNNDDYQLTKDTEYWYFGKDEMIVFAEAYHKERVNKTTVKRPTMKDNLEGYTLEEVHALYVKCPELFRHIVALDEYIDELEQLLNK